MVRNQTFFSWHFTAQVPSKPRTWGCRSPTTFIVHPVWLICRFTRSSISCPERGIPPFSVPNLKLKPLLLCASQFIRLGQSDSNLCYAYQLYIGLLSTFWFSFSLIVSLYTIYTRRPAVCFSNAGGVTFIIRHGSTVLLCNLVSGLRGIWGRSPECWGEDRHHNLRVDRCHHSVNRGFPHKAGLLSYLLNCAEENLELWLCGVSLCKLI